MRVVIVGAGLAGLTAARALVSAGHDVVVLERGLSPGGRMATRRIGSATVDHGAQFFTVRSDEFRAMVDAWIADGVVAEWCRGFAGRPDPFPRYRAIGGMNAVPRHLARGLDVRCRRLAFMLRKRSHSWVVIDDAAIEYEADAVVITTPVPQAYSFLIAGELDAPDALRELTYERTLALLVVLDAPSAVPEPGGVQDADATFSFVADNARKGVSAVPALTLHVRSNLSETWWDDDPSMTVARLVDSARPWLGDAVVVDAQLKRWRYATPATTWPDACLLLEGGPGPVVLAGDAFAGPKVVGPNVEGAVFSGAAAAAALLNR
ncbi:MAG: FAD-dependent oxidoreductase [Acidimicrobiales bacterium]